MDRRDDEAVRAPGNQPGSDKARTSRAPSRPMLFAWFRIIVLHAAIVRRSGPSMEWPEQRVFALLRVRSF
jgi:hypothetical protein